MSPELWNRIPPEAQAIFLQMAETIARLERRVADLEARLNKTPQNSSLPPSQRASACQAGAARTKVRQEARRAARPCQARTDVDPHRAMCHAVVPLKPDGLPPLRRIAGPGTDPEPLRHQVWEIPEIEPLVTEYQLHRLTCPGCCDKHLRRTAGRRAARPSRAAAGRAGRPAHGLLQAEQAAGGPVPGTSPESTVFGGLGGQAAESSDGRTHAGLSRNWRPNCRPNRCWASTNRRRRKLGSSRGCGRSSPAPTRSSRCGPRGPPRCSTIC